MEDGRNHTLHGNNETTAALDHLSDHIVNETVLVPDTLGLKLLRVVLLVDVLEDILEAAIVLLQDGVLGAHVQRIVLLQGQLEGCMGETADRFIGVVLDLGNTTTRVVKDLDRFGLAASGSVDKFESSSAGNHTVRSTVLVTIGVTTNDNGLSPSRNKTGDDRDNNGFTEDSTTAVWVKMKCKRMGRT